MLLGQRGIFLRAYCSRVLQQICTRRSPLPDITRQGIVKRCLTIPRKIGLSPPTVEELSILYRERLAEFRSKRDKWLCDMCQCSVLKRVMDQSDSYP